MFPPERSMCKNSWGQTTTTDWICLKAGASQLALVVKKLCLCRLDVRKSGSIPGWGRSPGGGHGNPLQCSWLENPKDRGAWLATVHRGAKSQKQLKWLGTHAHTYIHTYTHGNICIRHLFLARKAMTNLESILKSRDITLSTKVRLVKAIVFQVVMYGCENWTIKKAECWRIYAFELWCWRRLLRVS